MRLRRGACYILTAVVALSGLALAGRMLAGPLDRPIPIHSPLNAESLLAVAGILLILLRATPGRAAEGGMRRPSPWWDMIAAGAIAIATVAAFAWTVRFYFLADDFLLLLHARAPFPGLWRLFSTPGGDGFFRPVGYISYVLSSKWVASNLVAWHWIGIVMHAANAVLVYALAAAIGYERFSAWLAAMLFALHGAHPEAVVWVAGRFDLLSTLFFLLAMIAFVRSVDAAGTRCFLYQALALILMVATLLTKESAYAFPLIAVLFLAGQGEAGRRRWWLTLPVMIVTAALFLYRWALFGGIGGYAGSDGRPESVWLGASAIKALAFRLWAILFFPINWSMPLGGVLCALILIYLIALAGLFFTRAELRKAMLAVVFSMVAALPAVPQLLIGVDLEKSRVVYLPSIGFCLLLAIVVTRFSTRLRWGLAGALLAFQGATLWHNLGAWRDASGAVQSACAAVAACPVKPSQKVLVTGLPSSIHGVYAFANGFPECVAIARGARADTPLQLDTHVVNGHDYAFRFLWDTNTGTLRQAPHHP